MHLGRPVLCTLCQVYRVAVNRVGRCFTRMTLREIFARNLRHWRGVRGLSQEEVAFKADISRGYMSDLERATYSASLDKIERIAKVLGVDPAKLLERNR